MINPEQLKSIIELNQQIHDEIEPIVNADLKKYSKDGINIAESVALMFNETCELIQIPINDHKIGGMILKKNNSTYCAINTLQPRVFQNFVYLHEFYHLCHDQRGNFHVTSNEVETTMDIQERKANYYASLMLLDKETLRNRYYYLTDDRKFELKISIYHLMKLFKTTYKTLLIRLYEINCIKEFQTLFNYFTDFNPGDAYSDFKRLGLDTSIIEPSNTFSVGNLDGYIKKTKESDLMLEDFLRINLKEYADIVEKIKGIREI